MQLKLTGTGAMRSAGSYPLVARAGMQIEWVNPLLFGAKEQRKKRKGFLVQHASMQATWNMNSVRTPIPKRIIQTGKVIPESLRIRAMVTNIRLLHPDYEYLFFDDQAVEQFIDQEFPQYRVVFDSFRYRIQRYDFFRYLAIYRYGGFYFDLDIMLVSALSGLLEYGCVFPFEGLSFSHFLRTEHNMDWEVGNYAFGSAAGHPFIEAIIENCVRAQRDPSWVAPMMHQLPLLSKSEFYILYTTGPGLVSRTLAESPELAKSVMILFPDDVCDTKNWNCFGDLGIHLMDASWRLNKGRLRKRLASRLEVWKLRGLVKQSAKLGKTRRQSYVEDEVSDPLRDFSESMVGESDDCGGTTTL